MSCSHTRTGFLFKSCCVSINSATVKMLHTLFHMWLSCNRVDFVSQIWFLHTGPSRFLISASVCACVSVCVCVCEQGRRWQVTRSLPSLPPPQRTLRPAPLLCQVRRSRALPVCPACLANCVLKQQTAHIQLWPPPHHACSFIIAFTVLFFYWFCF